MSACTSPIYDTCGADFLSHVERIAPKLTMQPRLSEETSLMGEGRGGGLEWPGVSFSILSCCLLIHGTPILFEGDVRLVAERDVANWVLGRPQIFIEGSWQQICAAGFDERDSNVVCRQLGYSAGTVLPFFNVPRDQSDNEEPLPVGVEMLACDGTEDTLLECGTQGVGLPWEFREASGIISGCRTSSDPGLGIACVARKEEGVLYRIEPVLPWPMLLHRFCFRFQTKFRQQSFNSPAIN